MKKPQTWYILASLILLSTAMNIVDLVIVLPYLQKSLVKVVLFLSAPGIYFLWNKGEIPSLKELFLPQRKPILFALGLGLGFWAAIVFGYQLLKGFVDFSNITGQLTQTIGVSADNFIWVALYISFCNSLLEEVFFRGFGFMCLKNHLSRRFSHLFSSFLFAFYHIGMTFGWVEPVLFLLGLAGLMVGGCIFNHLVERSVRLYTSWIVHMFINFGINTVGFMLFGML